MSGKLAAKRAEEGGSGRLALAICDSYHVDEDAACIWRSAGERGRMWTG